MKKRVDTIEQLAILMADGFSEFTKRFDAVDARFDAIDETLRSIHAEIANIHRRLDRLEAQGASQAGFAKEIDYLLERVSKIEKHLHFA